MHTQSPGFFDGLRYSQRVRSRLDVWRGGVRIEDDVPFTTGEVSAGSGTGVRRSLNVTISDTSLWEVLAPGAELRPYRGVAYPNDATELAPLGVFRVDSRSMKAGVGGEISISSAPDRWARVQRARFLTPAASVVGALVRDEARRLMVSAVPEAGYTVTASSSLAVGALVWERDRDKAITDDLLAAIGAEGFFDTAGDIVIRDAPLLSAEPVWTVDAGVESAVLVDGDLSVDAARTYNVVVVSPSSIDGTAPFARQIVKDLDPDSPTFVTTYGEVPYFYASPLITTVPAALAAATTILNRVRSFNAQLDLVAACNPALEPGDVILVRFLDGVVQRHLIDSVTVPLPMGDQRITTRSSRPEGDVPAEE
jgi:hypothetical protein